MGGMGAGTFSTIGTIIYAFILAYWILIIFILYLESLWSIVTHCMQATTPSTW